MKKQYNFKIALTSLALCGFAMQGHAEVVQYSSLGTGEDVREVAMNDSSREIADSGECANCGCHKDCGCHKKSKPKKKCGCGSSESKCNQNKCGKKSGQGKCGGKKSGQGSCGS